MGAGPTRRFVRSRTPKQPPKRRLRVGCPFPRPEPHLAFLARYLPRLASVLDQGNRLSLLPCTDKISNHGFPSFGAYLSPRPDLGAEHGGLCLCCVLRIECGAPFVIAVLGNVHASGCERRARPVPPKGIPRA